MFRHIKDSVKDVSEEDKEIGNLDDLRCLQFTRAFRNQKKGHDAAVEALKNAIVSSVWYIVDFQRLFERRSGGEKTNLGQLLLTTSGTRSKQAKVIYALKA